MRKIIILFLLSHLFALGQNNYKNLFFSSNEDIVVWNFENEVLTINQRGFGMSNFCIAHIEDSLGNILFFTNTGAFYQENDSLIPGSGNTYSLSTEVNSCKIPVLKNKYYLFFNTGVSPGHIYYKIVDIEANGGLGQISQTYFLTGSGESYSEGL